MQHNGNIDNSNSNKSNNNRCWRSAKARTAYEMGEIKVTEKSRENKEMNNFICRIMVKTLLSLVSSECEGLCVCVWEGGCMC